MHACRSTVRYWGLPVAAAMSLSLAGISRSQDQLGTKDGLATAFSQTTKDRNRFFAGEAPTGAEKKLAEKVAKDAADWYLYRITHRTFDPYKVVHKEFEAAVTAQKSSREFLNYFGPALVTSMKEILGRDPIKDRTTVTQTAMMLPTMAKLKQEIVNDYLVSLVNEIATPEVVRLYALKALREIMPVTVQPEDLDGIDKKKLESEVKVVDALVKYIERPMKAEGVSSQQIAVIRYFRREAIISLAQTGSPAVTALKKGAKLEGPVAPTLLKVLAGDLQPPPSLQEKVEAALGLCAMKFTYMPEYVPDTATYLVGKTLLEYVGEYNKDWVNFAAVGAGKKLPEYAFKTDAKRFLVGLSELAKATKAAADANGPDFTKSAETAASLYQTAQPVLASMTTYNQPDGQKVGDLRQLVAGRRPKTGSVFRTLKAPLIPLNGE